MEDRIILHCDCNCFFASVETALNPEYIGVPMAVSGSVEDRRGIILAKNELAKKYGIETAETVWSAKKKCPNLVLAKPHYDEYVKFSKRVNAIYAEYTDLIEPFGIDESWLDVTASQRIFGDGYTIANKIKEEVKEKIGITISVGVSFNKVFAKLGSDYKKPDAITVIDKNNYKDIAYPLPASSLLFVGKKTQKVLSLMGVETIGELAQIPLEILESRFGKQGEMLYKYSRGLEDSPVSNNSREDSKSVGNGFTFKHDLVSREDCRIGLLYLSDEIGTRLREKGLKCTTVQVSIKDEHLETIQRQRKQSPPSDIGEEIANTAFSIVNEEWTLGKPIRMLTVTATGLVKDDMCIEQISFFNEESDEDRTKNKKKEETVDKIRQKFGNASIIRGAVLDSDIGIESENTKQRKSDKPKD